MQSVLIEGSNRHPTVPVLFSLEYYGYHDPESESIWLTASPANSPGPGAAKPNKTFGHRRVALYTYTQGALHNLNVDVSWVEDSDVIEVSTQGLAVAEVERFVESLVKKNPPFGWAVMKPHDVGTTTTTPS